MNIKTINSYILKAAFIFAFVGYTLKDSISYWPPEIRQWIAEVPSLLVQVWVICFTLVFFSGAIYIVLEYRTQGITKKLMCVLSTIVFLLLSVGSVAYMTTKTLNGFRELNSYPFDFGKGFQTIEDVLSSDAVSASTKAETSQMYAQHIYEHEGKVVDVIGEQGQKYKFEPSSENVKKWGQTKAIFEQGQYVSSMYTNRTIYSLIAFVLGLVTGLIIPKNRITKCSIGFG